MGNERYCFPTMDLLRSEPMQLVQLIIPIESAHRSISYIGDLALFQFKDVYLLTIVLNTNRGCGYALNFIFQAITFSIIL